MTAPIAYLPGETPIVHRQFQLNTSARPFGLAITERSVYHIKSKLFATGDPFYYERIDRDQVISLEVAQRPTIGLYILSALLIITGIALSFVLSDGGTVSVKALGYGVGGFVVGVMIPFVVPGRPQLILTTATGRVKWVPPLALDAKTKGAIADVIEALLHGARTAGMNVKDSRKNHSS